MIDNDPMPWGMCQKCFSVIKLGLMKINIKYGDVITTVERVHGVKSDSV